MITNPINQGFTVIFNGILSSDLSSVSVRFFNDEYSNDFDVPINADNSLAFSFPPLTASPLNYEVIDGSFDGTIELL